MAQQKNRSSAHTPHTQGAQQGKRSSSTPSPGQQGGVRDNAVSRQSQQQGSPSHNQSGSRSGSQFGGTQGVTPSSSVSTQARNSAEPGYDISDFDAADEGKGGRKPV